MFDIAGQKKETDQVVLDPEISFANALDPETKTGSIIPVNTFKLPDPITNENNIDTNKKIQTSPI